jgi:hypothetical protein
MISPELEAKLGKVVAMEEIGNLMGIYMHLVDARDWGNILDLFADDSMVEIPHMGTFRKDQLMDEMFNPTDAGYSMMCHQIMTPYIEVDGDRAKGWWYIFGPFTTNTPQGQVACWIQGKYDCDFVCVDGTWKFKKFGFTLNMHSPYEDGWVKTPVMET